VSHLFASASFELDQIEGVLPWSLECLSEANYHCACNADREEKKDLSVLLASCWVVCEDKGNSELEEVGKRKRYPVVAVYAFSYVLAKDEEGNIGEDDH
jgi:hypothetical protein